MSRQGKKITLWKEYWSKLMFFWFRANWERERNWVRKLTYSHKTKWTRRPPQQLNTPWIRVLLEKLTGSQIIKKFPANYGTRRFITAFTCAHQLSLSWARPTQSMLFHPTPWRSILILSSHLCLGLPSGSFPQISPTKPYIHLSSPPHVLHAPTISFFSIWSPEQNRVRRTDH